MAEVEVASNSEDNFHVKRIETNTPDSNGILTFNSTIEEFIPADKKDAPANSNSSQESKEEVKDVKNVEVNQNSKESNAENEWLDIMGSGNFKKLILRKGTGRDTRPERGEKVTVNVKYFLENLLIEEKENLKFIVGDQDVIPGLDLVVCLMEKDELARVKVPSKLAYGKIGREPDIPSESDLELEVELLNVEALDLDSLTLADRLQLGDEKRLRGNYYYERTEYIDAIHCYERAAEYLEGIRDSSGSSVEESQKVVDMIIKVYNNMTASHLKLSAFQAALKSVESVLNVQPKNVKALFRKAKILGAQGSTEEAINCLKVAAKLEPETKIIQAELARLRNQKKKEEASQKAMYKRMFPQAETKKPSTFSFSKLLKVTAVTAGCMAVLGGVAVYKQFQL